MALSLNSTLQRPGCFLVGDDPMFRSRDTGVVLASQILQPGAVVGKILVGATATAAARAGNTGTGVMGAITVSAAARIGRYQLEINAVAAGAGEFVVRRPGDSAIVGQGTVGVAYNSGGLAFTLADGTPDFLVGDAFDISVVGGTEKYKQYDPANTDGSQEPAGISWGLYDTLTGTPADKKGTFVTRDATVNQEELVWFSGATAGQKTAALKFMADRLGIIGRAAI